MTDLRHGEGVVVYFHSSSEDVASVVASTSTATATSLFIMDDNESEIFDNTSYMERLSWAVASYSGEWKDDREDGQGMKVYVNGSMFEGEFVAGIEHGRGVFKDSVNGSVYDGDWVQGKRHGQASFTLKGGEKYVGEYRHDLKHGRGLYTALDGVTFDVEFQRDEIVGRGLFRPPKEVDPLYFEEYEGGDRRQDGDTDRDTDRDRDRDSGMLLTLRDGAGYAPGGTKAGKRHGQGSYEFSTEVRCTRERSARGSCKGKAPTHPTSAVCTGVSSARARSTERVCGRAAMVPAMWACSDRISWKGKNRVFIFLNAIHACNDGVSACMYLPICLLS